MRDLITALEPGFKHVAESKVKHSSDEVLTFVAPSLVKIGYEVELGKRRSEKISRPVLFGANGQVQKSFEVDAFDPVTGTILEVEAGRGVANHQFLKDFFEACAIQDASYLAIAVLNSYRPPSSKNGNRDFETVVTFFDTLYASGRLSLPLKGILIIGYDSFQSG